MPPRIFRTLAAAAILFAVVLSPIVLAKDTPKERTQTRTNAAMPFVPSEQLTYEGEFTKLLLRGVKIAELRFKAYRPAAPASEIQAKGDGEPAQQPPLLLTTDVESKGFFSKLFGVSFRFHAESQVEPEAFYPLRTSTLDTQGRRVRKGESVFNQEARRVEYTESDPNNSPRSKGRRRTSSPPSTSYARSRSRRARASQSPSAIRAESFTYRPQSSPRRNR